MLDGCDLSRQRRREYEHFEWGLLQHRSRRRRQRLGWNARNEFEWRSWCRGLFSGGNTALGASNQSYIPEVTKRFVAARGVWGIIANPMTVDLSNTPGIFNPDTVTDAELIAYLTQARSSSGWAIFGFHGMSSTGEYSNTPQASHDALAQYLATNKASVWTATFRDIAGYVARCR